MKKPFFALLLIAATGLTACTVRKDIDTGQYWQRVNASEMAYTQGPKAQQTLNRDIARCVTELRELERLGQIKDPIPVDASGRILDPNKRKMAKNDTTDRDGYLLAEHTNYQDFESCMHANGWSRVKHVPYDVADRAKKNYFSTLGVHMKEVFTGGNGDSSAGYNDYKMND